MSDQINVPGPQAGITDLIDAALLKRQADDDFKYFPLRPSNAGKCSRRLAHELEVFYGIAEYPREEKNPETIRLLNLGTSIEWHSIKNFDLIAQSNPELRVKYKQQGVTLFRLKPVYDEVAPLIEGSIDLALINIETGEAGIGDVKSKGNKFHSYHKSEWDAQTEKFNGMRTLQALTDQSWYVEDLESFLNELDDPFFEDNFYQVNSYCCTPWAIDHNVTYGFIYRYCKNDSRHIEIRFKPSQKLFKKLEDKFNNIYRNVILGTIENVKPDCRLGSSKCAYGPLNHLCWGADQLKAYFDTWPKKKWPVDTKKIGLSKLVAEFEKALAQSERASQLERDITTVLEEKQVEKIKSDSGMVWQLKLLKTEGPVLRRTKL